MIAKLDIDGATFIIENGLEMTAWRRLTLIALLLRRFQLTQGHWPQSLDEAGINPSLRDDPLSGHPIHYAPERDLVWADGKDGKDDDGSRGDLVVHLTNDPPPPKPASVPP
jgi:hypothetical protein